jgi:hypothetical protein
MLPSAVIAQADTLDYLVMDVVMSYQRAQQEKAQRQSSGAAPPVPDIPINKLQEMIERVRR